MGGLARRATFIKSARARTQGTHMLLLDGGNTLWGEYPSELTEQSEGLVMVEAMDLMGYDAMALGETDLQLAEDVLRQRSAEADFPVLSANVVVQSSGELLTAPYALLQVGSRKVGVIGLTGSGVSQVVGSLAIVDPADSVARCVTDLQSQTDIVIILSSLGWEDNVRLAEAVPGIDVIIGGSESEVPTERWQSPQTGTLVCQLSMFARYHPGWVVTLVRVGIDGAGIVTEHAGDSVQLDDGWPDDAEIEQWLDSYQAQ